jgi:hypothetical protein
MRRRLVILFLIAAAALLVFRFGGGDSTSHGSKRATTASGCSRAASSDGDEAPSNKKAPPPKPVEKTVRDPVVRREVSQALRERLGARYPKPSSSAAPSAPKPAPAADDEGPRIDPKYIQQRVREDFFPLAQACYQDALKRSPKLAGTLKLSFTIVGDESIGGVVEDSGIADGSTIDDEELRQCMSESMASMTFPPPKGGGVVTVVYPIALSPGDDDDAPDAGKPSNSR